MHRYFNLQQKLYWQKWTYLLSDIFSTKTATPKSKSSIVILQKNFLYRCHGSWKTGPEGTVSSPNLCFCTSWVIKIYPITLYHSPKLTNTKHFSLQIINYDKECSIPRFHQCSQPIPQQGIAVALQYSFLPFRFLFLTRQQQRLLLETMPQWDL